ncbi:HTH-type transcriptional regulator LrpA [Halalkalicoccus paucihalophilus]|uniref:HTH-type transcriptional regulator LrpA n=1 Tax=Halalkalicoccus paucihalophilus TaxID=1008153 RepID=A0A151A9I2_9EURY|nr:winged helix-turn-helix transcriptional regulator [Halalkalicoccus paucihalophilus]KYH24358.1 HTH-type transcriptional regulator LrpA [Halalkalicoccus paucihalophilus]
MVKEQDGNVVLDDLDRKILYELQQDARKTTHEEISATVDVSPSTVRNRITALEDAGVIKTYSPELDYERAGFSLHVQFVCTAPMDQRHQTAHDALDIGGVITVQGMVTSERNLRIEVIATSSQDLTEITRELGNLNLDIHTSQIITNTFNQPFNYFEHSQSRPDVSEDATIEHTPHTDQE